MTQPDTTTTTTTTPSRISWSEAWAAYEDQVVATTKAWQEYQNANRDAAAAQRRARESWLKADQAYDAWDKAKKRREELHDAYWARYDQVAT